MMYPRLKLARTLLRNDGVLFISIDDNEVAALRKLGEEVFGRANYLATFVRKRRMSTGMRGDALSNRRSSTTCNPSCWNSARDSHSSLGRNISVLTTTAADLNGSRESLLEKLRLIEGKYLAHAAVLLFHPEPQRIFTGAYVKIGFFRNGTDVVYHDLIEGDLFTQAAKTVELIRAKYMKAAITDEGIHRVETYPVPYESLREAALNAIIHKDYATHTPIQIKVYQD